MSDIVKYDAQTDPQAAIWLNMTESNQISAVVDFHKKAKIKNNDQKAHAALHVIVENQIATNFQPTVRALLRLQNQGLSRHDVIHAIGSIIAEHMFAILNEKEITPEESQAILTARIEAINAKEWREKFNS